MINVVYRSRLKSVTVYKNIYEIKPIRRIKNGNRKAIQYINNTSSFKIVKYSCGNLET